MITIPTNYSNIQTRIDKLREGAVDTSTSLGGNEAIADVLDDQFAPIKSKLNNIDTSANAIPLNVPQDNDDVCGLFSSLVDSVATADYNSVYSFVTSKFDDIKDDIIKQADSALLGAQNDVLNQALESQYGPAANKAMNLLGLSTGDLTSDSLATDVLDAMDKKDIKLLSLNFEDLSNNAETKLTEISEKALTVANTKVQTFSAAASTVLSRFSSLKDQIVNMDACRIQGNLYDMQDYYKKTVEDSTVQSILELSDGEVSLNDASKAARSISNQIDSEAEIKADNAGSIESSVGIMQDIYDAGEFVETI